MIKRISLLRRAASLTEAEFLERWRGPHAALSKRLEGLRGYRLNTVIERPADVRWDGVAEMWFDSLDAAKAAFGAESPGAELRADAATIVEEVVPFFVEEFTVVSLPPASTSASPGRGR